MSYILTKSIYGVDVFLTKACLSKSEGWQSDFSKSRRDAIQFKSEDEAIKLLMVEPHLSVAPYKKLTEVKAEVEV